ncbi:hypothetical protein BJ742DRAFT_424271 [Cladochytrium replicatum]|nr:hypothetical protein BJ742DRAFT_424271 [Cladochytrium replicatum]
MAPTKRRDDCHKVDEQLDVEDCDAVIAHAPKKIAVPNLQPTRVRRGTKSAQIAANNKCGPTKSKSAVDEANTIEADRKEFTPSANPIIVDSGSFEESRATIKPRVDADVRRPKSGRQRIESEPKNIKLVEKVRREKESKDNTNGEGALLIVLDSSSEDDSTGRKGDRNSAVTGARISSKASGCEARAANDKPPNATFGLGSSLQSCTNDIPSKVEKEPQKNANNRRTVESQTVPDSSSSSDEENAPSQRAPSVFISPPRALELRDKNIEFLVTTRRRNRILHFKEGDLDSPAIDGAASRGGDVPPASGTEQNPMEVLSSLPPAHKERDPIQNPRPERKKTARPPNLLQKLLVQREESLKARTPSRIMDAHIGTGSKSIIAGDTNPIFDDQTRKGSIFVSNRLIDESHTCQSLDHRNNSKQDANPFVVPSSVNRAKENHEKPLYNIDHVLDSFSNLSISTKTKVPTNDSTSTLKPEITKQYGQRGRGDKPLADRRNEAQRCGSNERPTDRS